MKVKFRNNHLIFRASVEEMMTTILEVAKKDGDQEEAIDIMKNKGWTNKELETFDKMWSEAAIDIDPLKDKFTEELYKKTREKMDLTQLWCMK